MKKSVMIGAGNIGRGFIGMLLEKSGYHVVFADVNMEVINDINRRGEYTVHMLDTECTHTTVRNISAMNSLSPALVDEYAECELICTSVGLTALPKVAPAIAMGISARRRQGKTEPLNVIACENAIRASSQLKEAVRTHLSREEAEYMERWVGFPDCAVDRIVPPNRDMATAEVVVEKYFEWDVEKGAFKGEIPAVMGMNVVEDLTAYLERKLFTLNGPNAVTACYGYLKGYKTINEALTDREIYRVVLGMMEECSAMLVLRHGFTAESMAAYRDSLMKRFMNPYIIDDTVRVAREPVRKLSPDDRIIAPMRYAHEYGLETPNYYTGIASVLLYDNADDGQSRQIQTLIGQLGVRGALEQISAVPADSQAALCIEKEYYRLKSLTG